jgi:TetR/AcrR family transcriptional regulator, repressor for uid operon
MRKVNPVTHAQKRQEILDAASICFERDGFRGASISDICARADISPGRLYHYFRSKETIVRALTESRLETATKLFGAMLETVDPIGALISEILKRSAALGSERKLLVIEMLAEAARNPSLAELLREGSAKFRSLLAEFLAEAQKRGRVDPSLDPDLTAAILMSVIDGANTLAIRAPSIDPRKAGALIKILVERLLAPQ